MTGFESNRVRGLLAYLAVEADRPHHREVLAGLLWPDASGRMAQNNLRQAISNLRYALGDRAPRGTRESPPPFLLITRDTLQFNPAADAWLDVRAFEEAARAASQAGPAGAAPLATQWRIEHLERASGLYRGDFLEGCYFTGSIVFEEWTLLLRERLNRLALDVLYRLTDAYIERGAYEQARLCAGRQIELEPWREEAYRQLMYALALSGQRSAAIAQYEACRSTLADELGIQPAEATTALYRQIRDGTLAPRSPSPLIPPTSPLPDPPPCSYRGLLAFREADALFFFGREEFSARLAEAVHRQPITAIVGPSGSGKSSVVFAGLLPRLRQEGGWTIVTLRPGGQPLYALASVLVPLLKPTADESERLAETHRLAQALTIHTLPVRSVMDRILATQRRNRVAHLLLVVDQFEELYTLSADMDARRRFLDSLLMAAAKTDPAVTPHVVLTLRADFMGQALAYRPFADALQDATIMLGPMSRQELSRAVENPAQKQGVTFEPGLVARILDDVSDEPGSLPLLQFALTTLWERQVAGQMTHAAYEEIGRVEGALADYADRLYAQLTPAEQARMRRILVQMVSPGEGTGDARRIAMRTEMDDEDWALVQRLADARLVVTGRGETGLETAEIAHEALIQKWALLRSWVNEDRAFRIWQERLRGMRRQWEASAQDEDALLRGVLLVEAERWLNERGADLSPLERTFIRASIERRQQQQAARERELAARARWQRRTITGLAASLCVALVLALLLALQWWHAAEQRRRAFSNQLAAQALYRLETQQFDLALLLSLEAYERGRTLEARSSLLTVLEDLPYRAILRGHTHPVAGLAFAPDGRTLVSVGEDGQPILWEVAGSEPTGQPFADPTGKTHCVAVSRDGLIAAGGAHGLITLWDGRTGQQVGALRTGHTGNVESLAFSPDGRRLASGGADKRVLLWRIAPTRPGRAWGKFVLQRTLVGHRGSVRSLAFSPDGHVLASGSVDDAWGSADHIVNLWNIEAWPGQRQLSNAGHGDVSDLAFSPDGALLAVGGEDGTITLWDVARGQPVGEPLAHSNSERAATISPSPVQVAFSPDGRILAAGGTDGAISLWSVASRQLKGDLLTGHTDAVSALAFSPDGQILASSSADQTVILWAMEQPLGRRLARCTDRVWSVAFSPDGQTVAAGSGNGRIALLDATTGLPHGSSLAGHTAGVTDLAFSPDGRQLASGSADGTVRLWNGATGRPTAVLTAHSGEVNSIAFAPKSQILASGGQDATVILWNLATGKVDGAPLTGHTDDVQSVAFSSDGRRLASAGWDHTIILWDTASRQPLHPPLQGHTAPVASVAFSPDGRTLASGSRDRTVILWNVESGRPIGRPLVGHTEPVQSVAFSPDGRTLASVGCGKSTAHTCVEGDVRLWDVESGLPIGRFTNGQQATHTDKVWDLAFSPDGRALLTGGEDGALVLWDISLESWQARACNIVHRNLTPLEWRQYLGDEPYHRTCPNAP